MCLCINFVITWLIEDGESLYQKIKLLSKIRHTENKQAVMVIEDVESAWADCETYRSQKPWRSPLWLPSCFFLYLKFWYKWNKAEVTESDYRFALWCVWGICWSLFATILKQKLFLTTSDVISCTYKLYGKQVQNKSFRI